MKKHIVPVVLSSLMAVALVVVPAASRAADSAMTNAPEAVAPMAKKKASLPFHGKITAVDTAAMTLSIGTETITVTSETHISKDAKPATLSDITVGEMASGAYKKDDAGKLNATTIRVGDKAPKKDKKKADDGAPRPAPSVGN